MTNDDSITEQGEECCLERLCALGLAPRDKPQHAPLRRASVLVLLFARRRQQQPNSSNRLYTLITKRSMKLRSHPGECCFPGGRQDEEDEKDDVKTALREAQEEIGLDPKHVSSILCRLDTMESVNHLCVNSIVGLVNNKLVDDDFDGDIMTNYPWKINSEEVDAAFSVPLDFFLTEPASMFQVEWSGEIFAMRKYDYHDPDSGNTFSITGLTAHIAHEVARIAYNHPEEAPQRQLSATTSKQRTKQSTSDSKKNSSSMSGYLWKQEFSSRGRAYWTRRFFWVDASSLMLHQYDSEQQAKRKAQSATKKNRLPLENCKVVSTTAAAAATSKDAAAAVTPSDKNSKYEFSIDGVGGRIQWNLAAATHQDREQWMGAIRELGRLASS